MNKNEQILETQWEDMTCEWPWCSSVSRLFLNDPKLLYRATVYDIEC